MATELSIDGAAVKRLREERAWSQEHLAKASGLSLRTVQRIEADGTASPESVLALAGAFGVEVGQLRASRMTPLPQRRYRITGFVCSALGIVVGCGLAAWGAASLPWAQAGEAWGVIGTVAGLSFAAWGVAFERCRRQQALQ